MKNIHVRFRKLPRSLSNQQSITKIEAPPAKLVTDQKQQISAGLLPTPTTGYVKKVALSRTGMRVTYSRTLRRITLQRYLVSKIVWRPETVAFTELLTLYDNLLWCQDKSLIDPHFQEKFGSFLEKLTDLLKNTRFNEKTFQNTFKGISQKLKEAAEGHLIPERNLSTVEKHVKGKFHVTPTKSSGVPVKQLPPTKVIGRGYRDKGTYRDPAFDGSPSWQEVAIYFARKADED